MNIDCPKCQKPFPFEAINTGKTEKCPHCDSIICISAFPAVIKERLADTTGEKLFAEDQAGCFYHPDKKAMLSCENCGRFLCSLCDMEINNVHLCPACLELDLKKKPTRDKVDSLENKRTLYDSIALTLAVLPLFLIYFLTFITAPIAMYIVIRYWKSPSSILGRSRFRMILAFILAALQIGIWLTVLIAFIMSKTS